jgi:DMSO reductase anchor subunit
VARLISLRFALSLIAYATSGTIAAISWLLSAAIATIGVLIERWLFFAEAKHTVTLYYRRDLGPS